MSPKRTGVKLPSGKDSHGIPSKDRPFSPPQPVSHLQEDREKGQVRFPVMGKYESPSRGLLASVDSGKRRFWVRLQDHLDLLDVHEFSSRKLVDGLKSLEVSEVNIERSTAYHYLKAMYDAGITVHLVDQKKVHDLREKMGLPHEDKSDTFVILMVKPDEDFIPTSRSQSLEQVRQTFKEIGQIVNITTKRKQVGMDPDFYESQKERLDVMISDAAEQFVRIVGSDKEGREYSKRLILQTMTEIRFLEDRPETRDQFTQRVGFWNAPYQRRSGLRPALRLWYVSGRLKKEQYAHRRQNDARRLYHLAIRNIQLMQDRATSPSEDMFETPHEQARTDRKLSP